MYIYTIYIIESPQDFTLSKQDITFAAGSTASDEQCLTLDIVNDNIREVGHENFSIILVNPQPLLEDIIFVQSTVTVTIADCKLNIYSN